MTMETDTEIWDWDRLDGETMTAEEALASPEAANARVAQAMEDAEPDAPAPPEPADTHLTLPGGLYWDGQLIRDAEVRELNGEDEEELAKITGSLAHWLSVLLGRTVVRLGDHAPTRDMIRQLLIGDRDALLLQTRIATFGQDITAYGVSCPHCKDTFDATVDLSTVEEVRLDDPQPRHEYEVGLRRGRTAVIRFPDGAAQEAMFADEETTPARRNTLLLAASLVALRDEKGEHPGGEQAARALSVADRQTLLSYIADHQPGPQLDAVQFLHTGCGREVRLPLRLPDLFRSE